MIAFFAQGATESSSNIALKSDELKTSFFGSINWLSDHAIEILLAVAAGFIIYLGMVAIKGAVSRLRNADNAGTSLIALIGRTFSRTTHLFMAVTAIRIVVGYIAPPPLLFTTVNFIFTVVAAVQAAIWGREFILGLVERRASEDGESETLINAMGLIRVFVTFALFAIATIMVLDNLGVNVTGLVAGLGVGGIAIGLAAQGIFSDLFAALSIIFDKPFRQGETIHYDGTVATVEHIGLKSTRLRSVEGEAKIISNANLLEKEITNYQDIAVRRFSMPVGVIYQTPPEKALRIPDILREAIESAGAEFQRAGFSGFGGSSLDFDVFFFIHGSDLTEAFAIRNNVGMAILSAFAREGLEFAYPTQTTFTAAPDGTMIYPFTRPQDAAETRGA
ncbi:MAG: mechanosensitive ion channel [Sphingobium sp.]